MQLITPRRFCILALFIDNKPITFSIFCSIQRQNLYSFRIINSFFIYVQNHCTFCKKF